MMKTANFFALFHGLFFAGAAMFWIFQAAQVGGSFRMFGPLHFWVGLGVILATVFWSAFCRRRIWYTLTFKRDPFAASLPFQRCRMASFPLHKAAKFELHGALPGSVWFSERIAPMDRTDRYGQVGPGRIDAARQVVGLMGKFRQGGA